MPNSDSHAPWSGDTELNGGGMEISPVDMTKPKPKRQESTSITNRIWFLFLVCIGFALVISPFTTVVGNKIFGLPACTQCEDAATPQFSDTDAYQLVAEYSFAQAEALREYERMEPFSPTAEPDVFNIYLDPNGNAVGEWSETWLYEFQVVTHENENPTITVVNTNTQHEHLQPHTRGFFLFRYYPHMRTVRTLCEDTIHYPDLTQIHHHPPVRISGNTNKKSTFR